MTNFTLFVDPIAKADVQEGISYYNAKVKGLGRKFHSEVKAAFKTLTQNPYFQVRYNDVHCLPLKKFPYMIHYKIHLELNAITVYAVIHTSLNPEENWAK